MGANADQITYWNEVAGSKWVANQVQLDRIFAPLTKILLDAAAPSEGEQVLDVGCGCGDVSLRAAGLVGTTGHVLSIDISQPMLDHARSRANVGAPITWVEADAMTYAFAPATDLMLSRFGVMFFADPLAALRNLHRSLRPGGRFAFLCWRPRPDVEWMQWALDQIAPVLPAQPPTMGEPGPFGFADHAAVTATMSAAGFVDVTVTPVEAVLPIGQGDDPVGEAVTFLRKTGPAGLLLREAEPGARTKAEDLLRRAVEARCDRGVVQLRGGCWLYAGRA